MTTNRKRATILASALALAVSGCTSRAMRPADPMRVAAVPDGKATITFLRPSIVGGAIQASVFDVSADSSANDKFVGIVSSGTRVDYVTEPGQHLFMVIGENADFMSADLAPGKSHAALVTPRMGWWKARFSLEPIRASQSKQLSEWEADCELYENSDESLMWAKDNWESIQDKKVDYLRKWLAKSEEEKGEQTLRAADAR